MGRPFREEANNVVVELAADAARLHLRAGEDGAWVLPLRSAVLEAVEGIRAVFFPGYFGRGTLEGSSLRAHVEAGLCHSLDLLEEQAFRAFALSEGHGGSPCTHCRQLAQNAVAGFTKTLPRVRKLLELDVEAAYEGDPALHSRDEALLSYPGVFAVTSQRLAHELERLRVPFIPRMVTEHAHSVTGIDIHPGAEIGEKFFIDHGTGVVIGETAVIGSRVRLYQGVTLGAKSFPLDSEGNPMKGIPRHPIVEDDVVVYAGATILGRVTIGRGSSIGGNVWVTQDVSPGSRVTQARARESHFEGGSGI